MSRNRSSTQCQCGVDFEDDPGLARISVDSIFLRTWDQYLADTERGPDYSYREFPPSLARPFGRYRYQDEGPSFIWRSPDRRSSSNYARDGYIKEVIEIRAAVPVDEQYRFAQIRCRTCRRLYVGWYVQQPYTVSQLVPLSEPISERCYEIFDTSFYWSFDDEPSELDEPVKSKVLAGDAEPELLIENEIVGLLPPAREA